MTDDYATNELAGSGLELMGNALQALNLQDSVFARELVQPSDFTDSSLHSCPYTGSVIESELDSGVPSEYDLALIAALENRFMEPDGMGFTFDKESPPVVALGNDEIELRSMSNPQSVAGVESIGGLNTAHAWDIIREVGNTFLTPVPDERAMVQVDTPVKTEQPLSPRKPYDSFYSLLTIENSKDTIVVFRRETTRRGNGESFVVQSVGRYTGRYIYIVHSGN
jgi:hypothetical protein